MTKSSFRLIAAISSHDFDLLPQFLAWYRALGFSSAHLLVHGATAKIPSAVRKMRDVKVEEELPMALREQDIAERLKKLCLQYPGDWVMIARGDQLVELPYPTARETARALEKMEMTDLYCVALQRASRSGRLEAAGKNILTQHPLADYSLTERLGCSPPVSKLRYPFSKVTEKFTVSAGLDLPHNGVAVAHRPIRGVVHEFSWRKGLIQALSSQQLGHLGEAAQEIIFRYLTKNEYLPVSATEPYSTKWAVANGLIVRPTLRDLSFATKLRRSSAGAVKEKSIALVSFEVAGLSTNGGIGTSTAALAMVLAASGWSVTICYCPYLGPARVSQRWNDYWTSVGVKLIYVPRHDRNFVEHSRNLMSAVKKSGPYDLLHFHECCGYAALFCAARKTGHAFTQSRIVIATHGGMEWANEANGARWNETERQFESWALEHCDAIISPSQYMLDWYQAKTIRLVHNRRVLPNILPAELKGFGRITPGRQYPSSVAFFGRIEARKGIESFIGALKRLAGTQVKIDKVYFLGRFGPSYAEHVLEARLKDLPYKYEFITTFDSADAVRFMKAANALAVTPSLRENSPYVVFECGEQGLPLVTSLSGGTAELIASPTDEVAVAVDDSSSLAYRIEEALTHGITPIRLSVDAHQAELDTLDFLAGLTKRSRKATTAARTHLSRLLQSSRKRYPDIIAPLFQEFGSLGSLKRTSGPAVWMRCAILNEDPLVTMSTICGRTPNGMLSLRPDLGGRKGIHLIRFDVAFASSREESLWSALNLCATWPRDHFIFLANSFSEQRDMREGGLESIVCNINMFVQEWIFKRPQGLSIEHETIYMGGVDSPSEQLILRSLPSVAIIGTRSDEQFDWIDTAKQVRLLNRRPGETKVWRASLMEKAEWISRSRCALALQGTGDSCPEIMMYLMCGVPVVTIANNDGREHFSIPNTVFEAANTPDAVAEMISYVQGLDLPASIVRERALAVVQFERRRFQEELSAVIAREVGTQVPVNVLELFGNGWQFRNAVDVFGALT